ncbi:MAG: SNF2 helicase associated domain-containing protein [Deltaproteobacteria bacterium]|nr:SNF2 helicase associated domain-containing protein [Deltaproteobacteria bacterium]
MGTMSAKKMDIGTNILGRTDKAIRLIYWITIPQKNRDTIVVRFMQKRGDGKLLKLVSDRREMHEDTFRSATDRYLAEWLYDECIVEALDHCIVVPRHKIATFLSLLSKGRSFFYGEMRDQLKILPQPAKPILQVVKETGGNIQLSVKYKALDELCDLNKNDIIVESPLWVRNGEYIFEVENHEIFRKWPMLKKGVFSLGANQAHDFLFNQVPRLKQEISVEIDDSINVKESSKNIKPQFVIDIDLEPKRIIITPKVSYNNQEVPLLKEIKDEFLYFQRNEKGGEYIKRDIEIESKAKAMILQANPALQDKRPYSLALIFNKSPDFCYKLLLEIMDNMPTQWQWNGLEKLTNEKIVSKNWSLHFDIRMGENEQIVVFPSFKADGNLLSMYDLFKTKSRLKKIIPIPDATGMAILSSEICDFFEYYIERSAIDKSREFMVLHAGDAADLERRIALLSDVHFTRTEWDEGSQRLCKALQNFMGIEQVELVSDFQGSLRTYQHEGVNWLNFLKRFGFGGILADDMGLGKTIQTLAFLNQEKNLKIPSLVVCPTSVVENWLRECNRFAPALKVMALVGKNRSQAFKAAEKYHIIITSYPLIQRDLEEYTKRGWYYLIMDEAQKVKNHRTKTHEAFCQIEAKYKLALSGTPIENRLMELWSIFQIVMPGFLMSQTGFKRYWAQPIEKGNNADRRNELKQKLMPFILRRTKNQVLKELPSKTENLHYCELTEKQKILYKEIAEYSKSEIFKSIDSKGMEKSYFSILTALLRLRQICCHPSLVNKDMNAPFDESGKIQELFPLLEEIIDEGHRILLFSQFVEMLQIIQTGINQYNWESVYLDGSTKNRQSIIDEFQENEDIKIFLLSLKAGGVGINLTGADYVIHFDPWWNPAVENQATDRAHRIGQEKPVFVYRMVTRDTIEEKIHNMQQKKQALADSLITDETSWLKRLSLSDIENLFDSPV